MVIDSEDKIIWWGAVIVCYLLACLEILVYLGVLSLIACGILKIYFAIQKKKMQKNNCKKRENNMICFENPENVYQATKDLRRGYTAILDYDQYKRVNEITLCKDGETVKKIAQYNGEIVDYPNNPQQLKRIIHNEIYMSLMKDDDTFCFAYLEKVIQNNGDEDGFGVEPDENIIAYAILNGKGEYLTKFTHTEPEGYTVFRIWLW